MKIQSYNSYYLFFSNLSNPLRIKIVIALKEKDMCVMEMSKSLNLEQSKLSHALANLRSCNIVQVKRNGKERVYSLNKKTILPMLKLVEEHAKTSCNGKCRYCKNG